MVLGIFFEQPIILLLSIPLLFFGYRAYQKYTDKMLIISRIVVLSLLVVALAGPFSVIPHVVTDSEPNVIVVSDETASMELFDNSTASRVYDSIKKATPSTMKTISGNTSSIGDSLVQFSQGGDNIVLVSDLNNNAGSDLIDAIYFLSGINSTVYAIDQKSVHDDVGVNIIGNKNVIVGSKNPFSVMVSQTADSVYRLDVTVDNDALKPQSITQKESQIQVPFDYTFDSTGTHTITAVISSIDINGSNDYYPENNVFYKSIQVVEKPKILLVSGVSSPLSQILKKSYNVDVLATPPNFAAYDTVILDNMPLESISPYVDGLSEYISNGNGLVVVGGASAYDRGRYLNSVFETMLPVESKASASSGDDVAVVIVIDISGSTSTTVDIEKRLAIDILKGLSANSEIGVIAFKQDVTIVSPMFRGVNRAPIIDKIEKLTFSSTTRMDNALIAAQNMLDGYPGSKNVIVISDGGTSAQGETLDHAKQMNEDGITIYSVGVTDNYGTFMRKLADAGGGIYYKYTESDRLNICLLYTSDAADEEDSVDLGG